MGEGVKNLKILWTSLMEAPNTSRLGDRVRPETPGGAIDRESLSCSLFSWTPNELRSGDRRGGAEQLHVRQINPTPFRQCTSNPSRRWNFFYWNFFWRKKHQTPNSSPLSPRFFLQHVGKSKTRNPYFRLPDYASGLSHACHCE